MNKNLFLTLSFLMIGLIAVCIYFINNKPAPKSENPHKIEQFYIGKTPINIEYANTYDERVLGLSGREYLPEKQGLLFIFKQSDIQKFWMKDMNFPIDIIWIDENWRVADITENISPETYPKIFSPKVKVPYVLEVNAGFVSKFKINIGDSVTAVTR